MPGTAARGNGAGPSGGARRGRRGAAGATIITKAPPKSAYSNTDLKKALAELTAEGADTVGSGFAPLTVTLNEGGK